MTNYYRSAWLLVFIGVLSACGSVPEQQHEGVEAVNEAMTHGMRAYRDDRYLEARQLFSKGLAHYRSMDDTPGALVAYVNLIDVALVTGDFPLARHWLDDAIRLADLEDDATVRDRLNFQSVHLSWLSLETGSTLTESSTDTLNNLLAMGASNPDISQAALFLRTRIAVRNDEQDVQQWLEKLRESVAARSGALNLARLARLEAEHALKKGEHTITTGLLIEAQRLYRIERYRPGLAAVHEELSVVKEQQGDLEAAVIHAEQALFIRLWITDRYHSTLLLRKLAHMESTRGNVERADEYTAIADFAEGNEDIKWNTLRQRLRAGQVN